MKNNQLFCLLPLLIFMCNCQGQHHTDLQELGIKGPVKKMVIKNYYNVPPSLNADSAVLYQKDVFYLNRQGLLDSTASFTGAGKEEDLIMDSKSTILPRESGGDRQELIYHYGSGQTDTALRKTLSDSSYQITIPDISSGRTTITTYYLDQQFLVYKTRTLVLDADRDTLLTQGTEQYDKDSHGYFQKVLAEFSDLDKGEKKEAIMSHTGFDKHGNATSATLKHLDQLDSLGDLELRIYTFTYY